MIGTLLSNRYRLESKLGSGGMSTVYLAVDETLGRHVAAKVMHREISDQPDQIERFRREARAVAQLSHPNLVGVIDAGEDGGHPYIVFEFVPGQTLKERISASGRLPLDEATAYAIEIGRGLACAHANRLIHRDVKPQNVLIDAEGRAKITDFGIARSLESSGLTATGRVLGTTDYVSPEQAMGQEVDARTDVYSLGVVLYEMLTGDVPFHAETQVGVAMKHVNEGVPDVQLLRPDASAALAHAVERATSKDPADRYQDMNEFLRDLEGALEVEVSRAGRSTGEATTVLESVPRKQRKLMSRRRISWITAILLILVAAGAIAFAALTGEDGPSKKGPSAEDTETEPVELVSAVDFDPLGDGTEHADEVSEAIDGNPNGTGWSTEDYAAGLEGAGKVGVGIVFESAEAITPTELTMSTNGGWTFDLYGATDGPPDEAPVDDAGEPTGAWGDALVAGAQAEGSGNYEVEAAEDATYFLVWITDLGDQSTAEINDARIFP